MLGIIVLAAAVRLAVFQGFYRGRDFGFNDANYYSQQAIALTNGHWFIDPATGAPGAEHGPLTTLLIAPVSWMDFPQNWQRLATIATGVLCVGVLGLIGHKLGAHRANATTLGLTAAGLAAIYPNLWLNDGLVMSESLCALLVSLWVLIGLDVGKRLDMVSRPDGLRSSVRYVILFGAIGALGVLARNELSLLAIVAAVVIWRLGAGSRVILLGAFAAANALVLAPWVVPNLVRFENPVILTTNEGGTLRGANCNRAYSGRQIGSWSIYCLAGDPDTLQMETSQRSARWRADGLAYAVEHKGRLPLVLAARVGRTLDLFGLDYQLDEDVRDGRPRLGSIVGIGAFWLLAPLAVFGLRKRSGPWTGSAERLVLLAPVFVVAVSTLAFYGGHRIRSPMESVVVIGAALAITRLASRRRAPT
ncbi:hypothetical protein BH10ACT2_BH10ACT2_11330 [soil metagenome]